MIEFQKPTPPCVECKHFKKHSSSCQGMIYTPATCRVNPQRVPDHVNGVEKVYYEIASAARKHAHCESFEQRPKFSLLKFFGLRG